MFRRTTSAPRRAALATAGAAALALALPTTASAEPPVTDHFKGTFVHVEQEGGGCLEVPFPVEHEGFFNVTVKEQVRHGAVYVSLSGINLSTYTNLDTGASLRGHATFHDVDRKVVDNGDGTITVTFRSMRQESFHTQQGALVGNRTTREVVEVVIDLAGTPTDLSDDEVVSETLTDAASGAGSLGDHDECSIAAEYLA